MVLWRYNEHQNPLQGLLKQISGTLPPEFLIQWIWDEAWEQAFPGDAGQETTVLNNSTVSNCSLIETVLSYLSFTLFLLCPFGILAPYMSWSTLLSFLSWGLNCWFDYQISHTWEPTWAPLQSPTTKPHSSLKAPQWLRRLVRFLLQLHDNSKTCYLSSFKGSPLHIGSISYF